MFTAAQSPNKCSIKEANEHLQLLHQRVEELESTVQEQAEALISKDEIHQVEIRDLIAKNDNTIQELNRNIEQSEDAIKRYEQQLKEKDMIIDQLSQRFSHVDDLTVFTPVLERLVNSLKKIPANRNSSNKVIFRSRNRLSKGHSSKGDHQKKSYINAQAVNNTSSEHIETNDINCIGQTMSDLKIKRSFKINSNFSMSEDDLDNGDVN